MQKQPFPILANHDPAAALGVSMVDIQDANGQVVSRIKVGTGTSIGFRSGFNASIVDSEKGGLMANGSGKVMLVNAGQLGRIFALNWKAGIPTCVVGDNGTGKTSACEAFVDSLNEDKGEGDPWKLWKLILGVMEPADMGGYPVPSGGVQQIGDVKYQPEAECVNYVMPSHMDFFDSEVKGVVLADEFDRAKPDVQNAWLQFLLGRNIHGHTLSKNAYLIMTMNGAADIYTTPLSKAARTRMCFVYVSHGAKDGQKSWDDWADINEVNPIIRGFAKFRPDLMQCHEEYEEMAVLTPRSEVAAGQLLSAAAEVKFPVDDILLPVLAGIVGKAAAVEITGYRELYEKCPSPEEILADPENARLPAEQGILYAVGASLVSQCTATDRETAEKVVKYAVRMPTELTAFVMDRLGRRCPNIITTPTFLKWAEDHSMILT